MDRDKVIAGVLVVSLIFLFVALIGVVGLTGLVLYVTAPAATADSTPIINAIDNTTNTGTNTNTNINTNTNTNTNTNNDSDNTTTNNDPDPVCGNGVLEGDEVCEADSDCGSNEVCNASCACETKPPTLSVLDDLEVDSLNFVPICIEFDGEKGIGVSQIILKNTGSDIFDYSGGLTITSETDSEIDRVLIAGTKLGDLSIKKDATEWLYLNKTTRTEKFLYIGSSTGDVTIKIQFSGDRYIEYTKNLRSQDFATVHCE